MKRLLTLLLLFAAPLFSRAQLVDSSILIHEGEIAPSFSFHPDKDKTANLKDYRGKIIMVNFFATWCPPCRMELPRVQKEIWEKYKNNPKFVLFAFDREEGWDKVLPFKQTNQYTFLMMPDLDRKIYCLYAKQYIPRNIVIDENGKIIYQSMGYTPDDFNKLLNLLADKLK
jgi:thiol-disulfide isomerase/thioredoxin